MIDPQDALYFIYLGSEIGSLEGYEVGWEYPLPWIQLPQPTSTENLAYEFPDMFEAGNDPYDETVFPDPNRPRPPRK